jgi:cytochrome oxidase Cu insertion factor (SCO1/SenC/PrrC family)
MMVVGIFLLFATPLALAWLLYLGKPGWLPSGKVNQGELIVPAKPLPELTLQTLDNEAFALKRLHGRWTLLAVAAAECAAECERKLYNMRQVRTALGKDMGRAQRVLLALNPAALGNLPHLRQEYEGTWLLSGAPELMQALLRELEPAAAPADKIYLIDPLGNLMMYYPADANPKGILKDLTRLLKISQIG